MGCVWVCGVCGGVWECVGCVWVCANISIHVPELKCKDILLTIHITQQSIKVIIFIIHITEPKIV